MSEFLMEESGLGFALHHVDAHLLDHVLAWTITHPKARASTMKLMAGYVFWSTAFRLMPVFRATFSRDACRIATSRNEEDFPVESILAAICGRWQHLSYGRASVPRPFDPQRRIDREIARDIVNRRWQLFLSVAQRLPYDPERSGHRIDWDHIYPQARRADMKWHGSRGKQRLHYHDDSRAVYRAGNLCALHAPINRALQDKGPVEKLRQLKKLSGARKLWPTTLFLHERERALLLESEQLLKSDVSSAMAKFSRYVRTREDRLWRFASGAFPLVDVFRTNLFGA